MFKKRGLPNRRWSQLMSGAKLLLLILLTFLLSACPAGLAPVPQDSLVGKLDIGSYPNGWSDYGIAPQSLTSLADTVQQPGLGAFVLQVASDGQILESTEIALDGSFGFGARASEAVILVLASLDEAGKFICRSTLEYHTYDEEGRVTEVNPVILFLGILGQKRLDLGTFSFTGETANPAADARNSPDIALTLEEAPAFASEEYLNCDNANVSRPHIRGNLTAELPERLIETSVMERAIVIAAEFDPGDSSLAPLAIAPLTATGNYDLVLSKVPETSLEIVVFLADQSFLNDALEAQLHVPLVNLNHLLGLNHIMLADEDVDFEPINLALASISGRVRDSEKAPIVGAYVFAISNRGMLDLAAETRSNDDGFYELLVPVDDVSYLLGGQATVDGQTLVGTVSNDYLVARLGEFQEDITLLKLPR